MEFVITQAVDLSKLLWHIGDVHRMLEEPAHYTKIFHEGFAGPHRSLAWTTSAWPWKDSIRGIIGDIPSPRTLHRNDRVYQLTPTKQDVNGWPIGREANLKLAEIISDPIAVCTVVLDDRTLLLDCVVKLNVLPPPFLLLNHSFQVPSNPEAVPIEVTESLNEVSWKVSDLATNFSVDAVLRARIVEQQKDTPVLQRYGALELSLNLMVLAEEGNTQLLGQAVRLELRPEKLLSAIDSATTGATVEVITSTRPVTRRLFDHGEPLVKPLDWQIHIETALCPVLKGSYTSLQRVGANTPK